MYVENILNEMERATCEEEEGRMNEENECWEENHNKKRVMRESARDWKGKREREIYTRI